ncbi:MAG: dihydropteroate synthase [Desulfobacterales bacterium]|nr:dihydropteroate synthase [Desulfobacterales bacterium]
MGILNVTPDSFSDGGKYFSPHAAVDRGLRLFEEGADIIDIGGESTRPFSECVSADEEIRRVEPVISKLAKRVSVPISIDTSKAFVAKRALEAGASIINDIGALRLDPYMADVVAESGVPVILMHMRGIPKTMQISPLYDDLISEIKLFLRDSIDGAVRKGISKSKIIIDPGIGFGKTVGQNLLIIKHLHELKPLDAPILIGPSRKSFIRKILQDEIIKKTPNIIDPIEVGTQAAIAVSVLQGAHIVRVHEVMHARTTLKIIDAIKNM